MRIRVTSESHLRMLGGNRRVSVAINLPRATHYVPVLLKEAVCLLHQLKGGEGEEMWASDDGRYLFLDLRGDG